MRLMNSKFLGRLYTSRVACLFLCNTTAAFLLLLRKVRQSASRKLYCEASFTPPSLLLHEVFTCDGLLRIRIFLLCILLSTPFRRPVNENLRTWVGRQTADAVWSQNTDAIRDNWSQDTLLLKGTKTNCLYMLMSKVYGFLCYIFVQFPPYSRRQD